MTAERWLPVAGFEGAYEVSDQGRVRSLPRSWMQLSKGDSYQNAWTKGRVVQPGRTKGGYLQAHFCIGGVRVSQTLQAVVLTAFVGPRPAGAEGMHINHNKADNRLVNLKWGTRQENEDAKTAAGRRLLGEDAPVAKLTVDNVLAIRRRRGEPQQDLAAEFGCTFSNISAIQLRKSWRHV